MQIDPTLVSSFAPTGVLRVAINLGNPVLATPSGGGATGVSVDLGQAFAARLGVPAALVVVATAGASVDAVGDERADIGFFAIDPARAGKIAFTAPYLLIEGAYVVRDASPIAAIADVDHADHRVVVGQGSAYDLFLSRELKRATIVRAASSQAVVETFVEIGADVAAGVRQPLEDEVRRRTGLRLLDGRFMTIRQAVGVPTRRGPEAARTLAAFVEEAKSSGFVAAALARHGIDGANVAPAGLPD